MADVNLEVLVKESGTERAIANLESLQKKGLATAGSFDRVATAATAMAGAIQKATSAAGSGASLSGVDKSATAATTSLAALEREYTRLAQAQTNQTAAQRIANNLGSNPTRALNQIATLRDAYNADPIRDAMVVEQQEQEVLAARNGKLAATAALNESVWGSYAANLSAADLAMDKLTQAEVRYAEAQRATAASIAAGTGNRVAAGLPGAGNFRGTSAAEQNAINAAIQQEAVALNRVTEARVQLTAATEREAAAARTASAAQTDESQFGYFKYLILAGAAERAAQSILGIGEAAITASAAQQRAFADVDRTFDGTQAQLASLRQSLTDLSTVDPISFVDLASIAAMGNQLGIAAADIQSFTATVAEYSTISGESADAASTAFGKIANLTALPASQFSNLGSSIEYVARTTVATEASISSTAKEISALASGAGFSAQAIVGLSGALSSLSIPPERARGSLSLYFGALNKAIAEGGPKLQAFAQITGLTTKALGDMVANNQGQQVFTAFLSGLQDLNSIAKTTALKEVGLSTIRVDQTMRALSQNVPLVTQSFQGANTAFEANTELSRQYAKIQETLASRFVEFQNAVQNAASAVGNVFGPALGGVVVVVTNLLIGIEHFVNTPVGAAMAAIAGAIGLVAVAALGLVGAFALATAAQKVIPWALTSLGAKEANLGIVQFIGGLVGLNIATKEVNGSMVVTTQSIRAMRTEATAAAAAAIEQGAAFEAGAVGDGALAAGNVAVAETSAAAAVGLRTMKIALASTGIGLAVVLVGTLVEYLLEAGNAAKTAAQENKDFFGGSYSSGIADALEKDQVAYVKTGNAIQQISTNVTASKPRTDAWVNSIESATGAQVALSDGTQHATDQIKGQTIAYGDNAKAALATSLANSKQFQSLFKNTKANAALAAEGFDPTAFAKVLLQNPEDGGKQYMAKLTQGIASQYNLSSTELESLFKKLPDKAFELQGSAGKAFGVFSASIAASGIRLTEDQINALIKLKPAYETVSKAASATAAQIAYEGTQAAATAAANQALQSSTIGMGDGFEGATVSLSDYQDAVQTGLQTTLSFSAVLQTLTTAAGKDTKLINIKGFVKDLESANNDAVKFYNGLQQLAANGSTSFATQLASLGPAAQGILSGALKLSPEAQQKMEVDARFAAFLASDSFKKAFSANMLNNNEAYAQIFKATGNLEDVKAFMRAQVAGAGAEAEKAWDLLHPDFPLNLELKNPSPTQMDQWQQENDGKLTIKAKVIPLGGFGGTPATQKVNQYTDTATGATITLPATLDGKALSDSLAYWKLHENATPAQIAAALNTGNFSADINDWIKTHGAITLQATMQLNTDNALAKLNALRIAGNGVLAGRNVSTVQAHGGLQNEANWGAHMARFASGGGYGMFTGPGTGTSDSILARVSRGEYINTNDATRFWGADFFDSLNRKMLPASFAHMLGAAAASGNQGPQSVTNVSLIQNNPLTRDPLAQLREDSENLVSGLWGSR